MVLKLDVRVPMVWRDPFSLQFGIDPPRLVLRDVSTADERVIHALSSGIGPSGLAMVAQSSGASDLDLARLLTQLEPLLVPEPVPVRAPPRVAIAGTGQTAHLLGEALVAAGMRVTISAAPSDRDCDFGVAVGHYVLDPAAHGHWLRRDLPHLAVTIGDGSATVGPLVEPGRTPCLHCLEFHRRDADPSWSAIASQLWGRQSAAETPLVVREVVALAARIVVRRLGDGGGPGAGVTAAASFRIDAVTGTVTRREWMPHPDCGCTVLSEKVPPEKVPSDLRPDAARSGIDSAADSVLPTRVVVAGERA